MITYQPTDTAETQQEEPPVTHVYGHQECARRGCTEPAAPSSAYCTEIHERWDNPRVASREVTR